MMYLLYEYNQDESVNQTYSNREAIEFRSKEDVIDFVHKNNFYGKCYVYEPQVYVSYQFGLRDVLTPEEEFTANPISLYPHLS